VTRSLNRRRLFGAALGAGVVITGARQVSAQATPAASPAASPVAGSAAGPARMLAMLEKAPASSFTQTGVSWADLASAQALAGLEPLPSQPKKIDPAHLQIQQNLALPQMMNYAMMPEFPKTFGFAPFTLEQSLYLGDPPKMITLLRGPWNPDDLTRAWQASGFRKKTSDAGTFWSWAEEPELDMKSAVTRIGLGSMNNAAVLDDGTVVFAGYADLITLVMRTAKGEEASLAGDDRIAGIVESAPETLVSAMVLPGTALQQNAELQIITSQASPDQMKKIQAELKQEQEAERQAVGTMPRPSFGLLGVTGGTEPHIVVRLAVKSGKEADRAAKIVAYRLKHLKSARTQQPWTDLLRLVSASGQADPSVAEVEFAPTEPAYASLWIKMLYARDIGLIGW
jgi:hypothetical protein